MAAFFSGYFSKGERNVPTLVHTRDELETYFGKSTPDTYQDWLQAYNYLTYSDDLWITRVVGDNSMNAYDGYPSHDTPTLIWDDADFTVKYPFISVDPSNIIKAMAKTPGSWGNGIEIAIITLKEWERNVIVYNEVKAKDAIRSMEAEDYAIFIIQDNRIQETFVQRFDNWEEINYVSEYIYVKTNINNPRRYIDGNIELFDGNDFIYDGNEEYYYGVPVFYGSNIMELTGGYDNGPSFGDLESAYEEMNSEDYQLSYIIGNELAPISAINLAESRGDSLAFIGVPNFQKSKITTWRSGLGHSEYASLVAQYKLQYDDNLSKDVWVNIAGDVAGLKSLSDYENEEFSAAAGLTRGVLQNCLGVKYKFTTKEKDELFKLGINTVGKLNNYYLNGQKLLVEHATIYDRVNIKSLFMKLEREITQITRHALFEENNQYLRNKISTSIRPYLSYIKSARGIYDYHVICNETNNSDPLSVVVDVIVQPTYVTEYIRLRFTTFNDSVELELKTRSV